MSGANTATEDLLLRTHTGDRSALDSLLAANLEWLRRRVHGRLGPRLRHAGQTEDYLQDVVVDLLQNGPRFVVRDQACFRALLSRIVENVLADRWHWLHRARRSVDRERSFVSATILDLDLPTSGATRPPDAAARAEEREWLHLALELIPTADRQMIWMREWEGLSFAAIASELGLTEDAARMRLNRALPRLAAQLERLRAGRLAESLAVAERLAD